MQAVAAECSGCAEKFYYPCGGQAEFAASLANSGLAPGRLTTRLIWRKLLVISCASMTGELTPKLKLTRWWMLVAAVVLLVVLVSAGWFIFQDQRRRVYLRNGRKRWLGRRSQTLCSLAKRQSKQILRALKLAV